MKNSDVRQFQSGLNQVGGVKGLKFAYAVAKNKKRVQSYMQAHIAERNKAIDMDAFSRLARDREERRAALAEELAMKDENGKAVTWKPEGSSQEHFKFENMEEAMETMTTILNDEFADFNKMQDELKKFDDEWEEKEATLDIHMVSEKDLSEELTANQIEGVSWMIAGFNS